MKIILNNTL